MLLDHSRLSLHLLDLKREGHFVALQPLSPKQPFSQPNSFYVSVCTTFWPPVERYWN